MGMKSEEIVALIQHDFPGATVVIKDLRGDENHYAVTVTSSLFQGKSRVQQHQMVYGALKGHMGTTLHAMALTTVIG